MSMESGYIPADQSEVEAVLDQEAAAEQDEAARQAERVAEGAGSLTMQVVSEPIREQSAHPIDITRMSPDIGAVAVRFNRAMPEFR